MILENEKGVSVEQELLCTGFAVNKVWCRDKSNCWYAGEF